MGSQLSADKSAAAKHGLTVEEWRDRRRTQAWCSRCQRWLPHADFDCDRSRGNKMKAACRGCASAASTASRYGLDFGTALALRQPGATCQLCGREAKLEVDHDHQTGKVRGFLCGSCNKGIGFFGDDPELLERVAHYLREHRHG